MDKNTTQAVKVSVPNYGTLTTALPQFGMRYPDGTIRWVDDPNCYGITFKDLADDNYMAVEKWQDTVHRRAIEAKVNHTEYAAGHQLIKRTVIVAVTEFEEV